ncbi:MAG: glucose-6-phosphate dehydrogenase [bacterium]
MSSHPTTILLFGATGDLSQHKLFPALVRLADDVRTEPGLSIIAVGRRPYERSDFQDQVRASLVEAGDFDEATWPGFAERIQYYRMDFTDSGSYEGLRDFLLAQEESKGTCQRVFYLAVSPETYATVIDSLAESRLHTAGDPCWSRIVIEKPFGTDQASAQDLDRRIAAHFTEDQVYRIDHYLGKETVQNLLAFRFANRIMEPMWSGKHIDHVQITVAEEDGIRQRGAYYDQAGAFRDFVQNHILQLLSFIAVEEPSEFSFAELSDRKQEVLSQLRIDPERLVFGQYAGYLDESKVSPDSQTETFAMACFFIDNERWKGVPFYVRTGKRLARKITEVSIQFKPVERPLFQNVDSSYDSNLLTFRIQPDEGISLRLAAKTPRERMQVESVRMEFCYSASFPARLPDAYELVFQDVLEGEQIHSLRADTIEESWRIVDQILARKNSLPLHTYAAEGWGPEEADRIMERDGRRWLAHESQVCNGVTVESGYTSNN